MNKRKRLLGLMLAFAVSLGVSSSASAMATSGQCQRVLDTLLALPDGSTMFLAGIYWYFANC